MSSRAAAGKPIAGRITLTGREMEVIRMVCEGLNNKEIAERLSISPLTVRHHLSSIYRKLGVASRLKLVIYAYNNGLSEPLKKLNA
jgi:DNA-binding NarL/FixJ family response regulator